MRMRGTRDTSAATTSLACLAGGDPRARARLDLPANDGRFAAARSRLMCGICGVVESGSRDLRAVVDSQLAAVEHRGPDARGAFVGSQAVIGQNRLAIIDLVTGDPPITNEDRTVAVVLNGEIYNFRELREELLRGGHEFGSRGDTEVIAHLAEDLPPVELASRLDGMFSFAVWDERRGAARPRPRPGGKEAALLLVLRRPARVRERDQGAVRRSRRCRDASTPRRSPPT